MRPRFLPYLFMLPAIAALLFIYGGPILGVFFFSVTDWNGISPDFNFVGLNNFINILKEGDLANSFRNTLLFLVITLIFQNIAALLMAVLLNKPFRGRDIFRTIFFLPATISIIAIGLIWSLVMDPINGPIAAFAELVNWPALADVRFLGSTKLVMYSIAFVNIWQWAGWNMVIYIAGLQNISKDLYEAADIDGANGIRKFFSITLPLLAPSITINVVMTTIGGLKVFDLPFIMTGGGPGRASETITMTIINNSFSLNKMGYGSAMSVVLFALILLVTLIQNTALNRLEERTYS